MTIERHRTALRRTALSSPMAHLLRFGFLDGSRTLFDYGCGHGDDVRLLREMNIEAKGWDPAFKPRTRRTAADIVNLGFVLNVIDDADERAQTLAAAFELAREVLIISVMLGYQAKREQFAAHEDGVRTQRNTFQKYYAQDEFIAFVQAVLDANAIPIAPGICLVFKHPVDEQLFLLARQQVRRSFRLLARDPQDAAVSALVEEHRQVIDAYWRAALELGRPPHPEESPEMQTLIPLVGTRRRVHEWVGQFFDAEEFEAAEIARTEDLLVYFALNHFGDRKPYKEFPDRLRRDVRHFFGNITKARSAGKRALFAAGQADNIERAAAFCHDELGIGKLVDDHDLTFHQSMLGECLPLVRIFVGCALRLFGEAGAVDLIKVHLHSGKVTFLVYDDFDNNPAPRLVERIKVDLPRLRVDFFDYTGRFEPQPLEDAREAFFAN